MNRPFPIPSDFAAERPRPCTHIHRAARAHLRSFVTGGTPSNIVKSMWADDRVTPLILRAASGPAAISGTSAWAASLAGIAIYDLIQSITSLSAAADVIDRGLKLNLDSIAEMRIPGRVLAASAAGQWIAEGQPIPARQLTFANAATWRPRKLSVLTAYSREQVESSNIEAIVRQTLGEAVALALDTKMFSADAASASAPAGLFAGVAALTATAGGGDAAMDGDLKPRPRPHFRGAARTARRSSDAAIASRRARRRTSSPARHRARPSGRVRPGCTAAMTPRSEDAVQDRLPMPGADPTDRPPNDIQCQRCGSRHTRLPSGRDGMLQRMARRHQPNRY